MSDEARAAPEHPDVAAQTQDMLCDVGDDDISSISHLIDNLLGGGERMQADAGLARFSDRRLIAIQQGAERQADESLRSLQSLSYVLGVAASHPQVDLPGNVLRAAAEHLHSESQALDRWRELASNASYPRKNRCIADGIARRYALWSVTCGEWPEMN